jgi:hypothetical protein
MLEEGAGNVPQGIALDDDVLVGGIRAEGAVRGGLGGNGGAGGEKGRGGGADRERPGNACAKIFHWRVRKVPYRHGCYATSAGNNAGTRRLFDRAADHEGSQ